jgi:hypothetical protein
MSLVCRTDLRRDAVRAAGRNGLDYIEVVDGPPPQLYVYFLGKLPAELATKTPALAGYLRLAGGDRITGLTIVDVAPQRGIDAEHDDFLVVTLDRIGDFSTYTLTLVGVASVDSQYQSADFSFRIDCASGVDCKPSCDCRPPVPDEPTLNYLAKDYASFRQLILDRMALLVPQWTERHVPDIGVTLVELLAYAGDTLSYYQDAVATEAYLGTARQRISVRRHARLVDYRLHEGCNARGWVQVAVSAGVELPARQVGFATRAESVPGSLPVVLDAAQLDPIAAASYEYFEPLLSPSTTTIRLRPPHNAIRIYTWGRRECCLPAGATQATLLDTWLPGSPDPTRALDLHPGDILIFEEVLGAKTGVPADADPGRRWAVRVTSVELDEDPLFPVEVGTGEVPLSRPTPLVTIGWAAADALPFALCISAIGAPPDCAYLSDVSVVRGNIVPVDHGRTLDPEPLGTVPAATSQSCCECEGRPSDVVTQAGRYRPVLSRSPLTYRDPSDPTALPAATALAQDPRLAVATVAVSDGAADWVVEPDLLESAPDDRNFVVEIDNDGFAHLRFGDGTLGRAPDAGSAMSAVYRVGGGKSGDVGAEAICHLVLKNLTLDAGSISVRNPLPAQGGVDPEPIEEAKQFAPLAFRDPSRIERAITAADYASVAGRNPALQGAAARLAWTGSWYEADVSIDPLHEEAAPPALVAAIERDLHCYRRLGHDLRVQAAVYVPLTLGLSACALPGYDRGHVKVALAARFSNRVNADGSSGFFHPDNLGLGQSIYLSRIVAAAQSVAGVASVVVVRFHRFFEQPNMEIGNGILPLAYDEIAQLDNDPDHPERGQLSIVVGGGR